MLGPPRITKSWISGAEVMVHRMYAAKPGPTVLITANVHGDECVGLGVVFQLLSLLPTILSCGQIHLYPSLNPQGLAERTRVHPPSGLDLNRLFPGRRNGNEAEQHLWAVWQDIVSLKPSALIDLHTDSQLSIPYALVDRSVKAGSSNQENWDFAVSSGLLPVWEYPIKNYIKYNLDRSLSGAIVNKLGVLGVTLELGPRRVINMSDVRAGLDAVLRMLGYLGMLTRAPDRYSQEKGALQRSKAPVVHKAGVFVPLSPLGKVLQQGETLGTLYDINGAVLQQVQMPRKGVVLSYPDYAFLKPNQACATLAAYPL